VVAAGALLTGGLILKSIASSATSLLRQKLNDSAYRGGHWPPAVTG